MKVKIENMKNLAGTNTIKNQFIIYAGDEIYFQSYATVIACVNSDGELILCDGALDFSKTTNKYLYKFINEFTSYSADFINRKNIEKEISAGNIKVKSLIP